MLWSLLRNLVLVTSLIVSNPAAFAEQLKATAEDGNLGLDFKSQYADVNGVRLHYVEGGKGQQTLVLIPGWPQTWYAWRKIMPELAKTYRVIAVDIRGMGDSGRPENGYDTQTVANDISALMSELGVSRYRLSGTTSACGLPIRWLPSMGKPSTNW
jgi:hypothetical protein